MAASKCLSFLFLALFSMALVAARPQEEKPTEISNEIPLDTDASSSPATAAVSTDPSTASETTTGTPPTTTAAPPRGTAFSRIINDIFQIPISVLRAVNNLLNNSFGRSARSS